MLVDGTKFREARSKANINAMRLAIIGGYNSEVRIYQIETKTDGSEVPDIRLLPMVRAMGVTMADVRKTETEI